MAGKCDWWSSITDYQFMIGDLPTSDDLTTFIGYAAIFLVSWFVILHVTRFLLSLIFPLIMMSTGLLIIRFLRTFNCSDFETILFEALNVIIDLCFDSYRKMWPKIMEFFISRWSGK
ncbi:uncharacterized protein LOC119557609 [Drosophila subpulchrella]|uniref:uncharacterized protein LOC119557609 n=1 Tax=Drosophila subpulchrella TaxID=1486046 RepID=UPI0018A17FAD|nr:uncharacterized protein LOC119557609 [Drosophila subpulchrella]